MNTLDLFSLKGKTALITGGCGHLALRQCYAAVNTI